MVALQRGLEALGVSKFVATDRAVVCSHWSFLCRAASRRQDRVSTSRHLSCGKGILALQTVPKSVNLVLRYSSVAQEVSIFIPDFIPLAKILATSSVNPSVTLAVIAQSNMQCISQAGFQEMYAEKTSRFIGDSWSYPTFIRSPLVRSVICE